MGRGRKGTGVDARDGRLRIRFTWQGVRVAEMLDLKPTAGNIRFAARLVSEIREAIKHGTFVYISYFPDSPRAQLLGGAPARDITFRNIAEQAVAAKLALKNISPSTAKSYRAALSSLWNPHIGDKKITIIMYADIVAAIGSRAWGEDGGPTNKTLNNYVLPLKAAFEYARKQRLITREQNPTLEIDRASVQKPPIDPFATDERDLIITDLYKRYHELVGAFYEFAFATGMRNPSEIIPLRWSDIDWNRRTARVDKGWVDGALKRSTKTNQIRDVHLNDRAMAAIARAKPHSFLRGEVIFLNPVTWQPHGWDSTLRDGYWNPSLKRLGIRRRVPYNTRHTFATALLMGGVNPAYIARQLGHRNAKMLFERYSQWIEDVADDIEREKASGIFGPNLVRDASKLLK